MVQLRADEGPDPRRRGRHAACVRSRTRAPSSSCRSPTSRSSSTASSTGGAPGSSDIGIVVGSTTARPRSAAAVGDGSQLRRRDHLHPAGRAARARALRAHRPRLPRRRRLRHVPRRQHAAADLRTFVDRVRSARHRQPELGDGDRLPPAAQILLAHVDDPRQLRRGRVRRGRRHRAARREAGRSAVGPRARRRVPVRPDDPRGGARDRTVGPRRARDHRRDPVAHRPRPPRAPRDPRRAGGSTPARRTRCSTATASCSTRSSTASTARRRPLARRAARRSSRTAPS